MIGVGVGTVHTSAMVGIGISPPSLAFHTKPLTSVATFFGIPLAPRFPSLKNRVKRNRVSSRASEELHGLGIEDTDELEEQILGETAPLVAFMKMVLQPGRYRSGDRLDPEHEKIILERILPYHPGLKRKIGNGIDYITLSFGDRPHLAVWAEQNANLEAALDTRRVEDTLCCYATIGYHPDFGRSRCLFIAQKDGEMVDFSYWKCIKGLIRKKYSQDPDNFIFKYFRWRERL